MELVSGLSLASHLAWPIFGLTQCSSWWHARLSAKMDSSVRASGRLAGRIISSLLPLAPPKFFLVSFTRHIMGWLPLPPFGPSQKGGGVNVQRQHRVLYQDLLLRDNSCKCLSSCLAKVDGFGQQFPNTGISEWLIVRITSRTRWVTSAEGNSPGKGVAVSHQQPILTAAGKGCSDLVTGIGWTNKVMSAMGGENECFILDIV